MKLESVIWIVRVVAVIALLGLSAALATPKGRLPLALRGVSKIMRRDRGITASFTADGGDRVSSARKLIAFLLALVAIVLALI